jgi:formylglycine-generating enzyme required for sulfatase activity
MFSAAKKMSLIRFFTAAVALAIVLSSLPGHAGEREWENSLGMEFVLIPAGSFDMGSPPGEPHRNGDEIQHKVTISRPFYMQTTEVTLKQWWEVMGKKFFGRRKGKENSPVVKVSWFDCIEFIEKLNRMGEGIYRLPTEAEWEYACRAGTTSAYFWGENIDCSKAMYSNNPRKSDTCSDFVISRGLKVGCPAIVKSFPPNGWGLYDMHGNVWEWCRDFYGQYPKRAVVDPKGPGEGKERVRRGGSWFKDGWLCRSANRNMGHPASKYDTLGFRLVREIQ